MIEPRPAYPFAWTPQPWGAALHSARLDEVALHLFTTRDLVLRGPHSDDGWRQLAAAMGVKASRLVRLKQVHGTGVIVIRAGESRKEAKTDAGRPRADIVMTDDPTVAVAVHVADCVPLLLADSVTGAVAAVHAGWRGTAAGAARQAVSAMQSHFGTRPVDLIAAMGPSIGPCCYQVGSDIVEAFRAAGTAHAQIREWFRPLAEGGPYRLDLAKASIDQLRAAGLDPANIDTCGLCTACHPSLFHSYRRDGVRTGRLAGVIRPK